MTRTYSQNQAAVGIVVFPGSNCDADCIEAFKRHFNRELKPIWHTETKLDANLAGLIIPGGFSYGDYLRGGALASHAPIMPEIQKFAKNGGSILGICNGFQILTEMGLLPGVLLQNDSGRFVCRQSRLQVDTTGNSQYHKLLAGEDLKIPIAHGEGRYFAEPKVLDKLRSEGQILLRYHSEDANPNGSEDRIAGIISANGKVVGMMPHPERATETMVGGSKDGLRILEAFLQSLES